MSYFVRKINRAKWNETEALKDETDINKLNADYLATCLRTQQGVISLWKIDDPSEIKDVAVAICSVGEHIDKVDFVLLDDKELQSIGIIPQNEPEGTSKIKEKHYKVENLNYKKIGSLACLILDTINNKENGYIRIKSPEVKQLLLEAIKNTELKLPLDEQLMTELGITYNI